MKNGWQRTSKGGRFLLQQMPLHIWCLEDEGVFLGPGLFSRAFAVGFREGTFFVVGGKKDIQKSKIWFNWKWFILLFLGANLGLPSGVKLLLHSLDRSVGHHALKRKWLKLKQLGETRGTEGCQKASLFETRVAACQKLRLMPWHCFNKRHINQFFEIDVGPVFWVSKLFSNSTFFSTKSTIPRKG